MVRLILIQMQLDYLQRNNKIFDECEGKIKKIKDNFNYTKKKRCFQFAGKYIHIQ